MKAVYIADPAVAASYHVDQGSWITVEDDEADWLVTNHHAWGLDHTTAVPAAGYVDPAAPNPFVPYGTTPPAAPAPRAAPRTLKRAEPRRDDRGDPEDVE